jgi:hypothetical protein
LRQGLTEILAPLPRIDLVDMDIQGAELEVVSSTTRVLEEEVKRVHISTHLAAIEAALRDLFSSLGWFCLRISLGRGSARLRTANWILSTASRVEAIRGFNDFDGHRSARLTRTSDGCSPMMVKALARQADRVMNLVPSLRHALACSIDTNDLTIAQATLLTAIALDIAADLIIDVGTGAGNSAITFAIAQREINGRIYTLGNPSVDRRWSATVERVTPHIPEFARIVTSLDVDITRFDFAPIVADANSVLVFWDAHGYAIADSILSRLLPLIADRRHVIVCHDMSDNRIFSDAKSYRGRPFWRGAMGAVETAYVSTSWVLTQVEQAIPILDFCWRNDMLFRSFDGEIRLDISENERTSILSAVGLDRSSLFHMGYFTMNETPSRHFPAPAASELRG